MRQAAMPALLYVYSGNGHYSAHCHTGWLTHLCQAAYSTGTNYSGKPALWRIHDCATVGQPALTVAGHRHCFNRHYREITAAPLPWYEGKCRLDYTMPD